MSAIRSALVIGLASVLALACTSSSTNDGSLTICRHLPATSTCSVDLAYLSCSYPNDAGQEVTELCLSDNVNACPDSTNIGGCSDLCRTGEYAATCGGPPSGDAAAQNDAPSPSCRTLSGLPSGTVVYCCPCGS